MYSALYEDKFVVFIRELLKYCILWSAPIDIFLKFLQHHACIASMQQAAINDEQLMIVESKLFLCGGGVCGSGWWTYLHVHNRDIDRYSRGWTTLLPVHASHRYVRLLLLCSHRAK